MALRHQVVQSLVHALRLFKRWQDHMNAFGPEGFVSDAWTCPFGVMHTLHSIRGNQTKRFTAFQI